MISVVPAILAKNPVEFEERLRAIEPHFTHAQIDVANDTIIEGRAWGEAEMIEPMLSGGMTFEIHLMVDLEEYDLEQWNREWVDKIIIHVEAGDVIEEKIDAIKTWDKRIFLALNPDTPLNEITPYLPKVDGVMFMTVDPGQMGNNFRALVLDKIKEFHETNPNMTIEADGGITNETLPSVLSVGVTAVGVGSYFKNDEIEERLMDIIPIVEKYESK